MKYRLLLLMIISAISLSACGNTNPTTVQNETEVTIEENSEIVLQEDGTYYVSDEVRQKFKAYRIFAELTTEEEFDELLQLFLQRFYPEEQDVDALLVIVDEVCKEMEESDNTESETTETNDRVGKVIARDGERGVTCSQEMLNAVHKSLERVNLDNRWTMNVLFDYLEVGNDEKVETEVIDNIVDSLKKELVAQEKAEQAQKEQSQQNQGGSNNNEAPSDWVTPEKDPSTDENYGGGQSGDGKDETLVLDPNAGGDGGDLISDGKLNIAGDGPGPGEYARPSIGDGGDGGDLISDGHLNP